MINQLKEYCCPWCNTEFKKEVAYFKAGKRGSVSTQVQCPECCNLIPTWKKINGVKIR